MPISTRPPRNPPRSTSSRGRPHGPPGRHRRLRVRTRVRAQHVADWPGLCTGEPMASVPGMVATPHAAAARPTGISCVASTRTMAATSPPTSMPCQSTCPPRLRPYRPRLPRFRTGRKSPHWRKGTYDVDVGGFPGSAAFDLADPLDAGLPETSVGSHGFQAQDAGRFVTDGGPRAASTAGMPRACPAKASMAIISIPSRRARSAEPALDTCSQDAPATMAAHAGGRDRSLTCRATARSGFRWNASCPARVPAMLLPVQPATVFAAAMSMLLAAPVHRPGTRSRPARGHGRPFRTEWFAIR